MSGGIGDRLSRLRALHGISARDLAARSGVAHADLIALEAGGRRMLSESDLRRLAELFHTTGEYLLSGEVPSPAAIRTGFFRLHDSLSESERKGLKFAPIQGRVEAVLRYMEGAYPTVLDRSQVAARLGYTPEALEDVLRAKAPLQSHLLRLLVALTGLSLDFFVRGDGPDLLSDYYEVIEEAIAAGISPAALRKAVKILSIREDQEE